MKKLLIGVALMLSLSLFATEKPCERPECRISESVVSIGVIAVVETPCMGSECVVNPCNGDQCAIETETEVACDGDNCVVNPCQGEGCAIETETEVACVGQDCVVNPCDGARCKEV